MVMVAEEPSSEVGRRQSVIFPIDVVRAKREQGAEQNNRHHDESNKPARSVTEMP